MPDTQITDEMVCKAADAMERHMFAPHELPLDDELHAKYIDNARAALQAALSGHVVVPREPLNDLVGRLRFEREINKQRISGTDWNFYLEPLGFPAPQMERG